MRYSRADIIRNNRKIQCTNDRLDQTQCEISLKTLQSSKFINALLSANAHNGEPLAYSTIETEKQIVFHQFINLSHYQCVVFGLAHNSTINKFKCHKFENVLRIENEFTNVLYSSRKFVSSRQASKQNK